MAMEYKMKVHTEWPEEEKKAIMDTVNELHDTIEKANALADALALKMKNIRLEVSLGSVEREVDLCAAEGADVQPGV